MGETTSLSDADADDYVDAFNFYLEMLSFWENFRGIVLPMQPPTSMDDPVGTGDPIQALKQNLILFIADHFSYTPTFEQKSNAARSFRILKSKSSGPAIMNKQANQPRGSGNTWRNTCSDECTGPSTYVTNTGFKVSTDE